MSGRFVGHKGGILPGMSSSLVKVRTPARDKHRPHRGSSSDSVEERHDHAVSAATSDRAVTGTNRQARGGQGGAAAAAARGDDANGGVGGVFALGDMLKHKMNEVTPSPHNLATSHPSPSPPFSSLILRTLYKR